MTTLAASCSLKMKVLADETRLAIIRTLMSGPKRVTEINLDLKVEQSLLSHHLKVLRDAKLVTTKRDGKSVCYRLSATVAKKRLPKAIDLGCCTLTFD